MMENITAEKWISIDEAASHLGVKPVTIRDWIRKGKDIPAHKIGKQWKFRVSELDNWVQSGQSADFQLNDLQIISQLKELTQDI